MNMKVMAIGGVPASGKSTLMRAVLSTMEEGTPFVYGKLRGYCWHRRKLFILGIYDEKLFSGTDRLSMAVQTDAEKFLTTLARDYHDYTLLFEGDRLFNRSFLTKCLEKAKQCEFLILTCSNEESERRHIARKDTQTEKFKKGRMTKYTNLVDLPKVRLGKNENELDQAKLLESVLYFIGGWDA